ncbi:MAG TPA: flavin monoamine oxidase family protein [Dehalococcoidia bacterium]
MEGIDADVCIVGAGYAGLTAARRLAQAGKRVVVLEARDRVGGRVYTRHMDDGAALDMGGTWLGGKQDAAYALASELGIGTYPTYSAGATVFVNARGDISQYRGTIPKIGPLAIASLAQGMYRIDAMARSVSLDEPWTGKHARSWDARTIGAWIDANVPVATAKHLLHAAVRGLMTADPSEISLLHMLYLVRSAGGLNVLLSIEGGYQQDRVSGGAQSMANRIAADLGEVVHLQSPVTHIDQDAEGVTVRGNAMTVRAKRAVVTIPPALAARLHYDPPLPLEHMQILERMTAGAAIKMLGIYEDAFWRDAGLNGQSVAMNSPIETTLDASPSSGRPGVIAGFAFGPEARKLARLTPDERRHLVLETFSARFGARAIAPIAYEEMDWEAEEWTRGCHFGHLPPGILTQYGYTMRSPNGRLHWAGTETATVSVGTIDGAIRSGQRAAAEILASST